MQMNILERLKSAERHLEIVNHETGEIVHRVDVSSKSERDIERIERGMLRNIRNEFMVRDTALESKERE